MTLEIKPEFELLLRNYALNMQEEREAAVAAQSRRGGPLNVRLYSERPEPTEFTGTPEDCSVKINAYKAMLHDCLKDYVNKGTFAGYIDVLIKDLPSELKERILVDLYSAKFGEDHRDDDSDVQLYLDSRSLEKVVASLDSERPLNPDQRAAIVQRYFTETVKGKRGREEKRVNKYVAEALTTGADQSQLILEDLMKFRLRIYAREKEKRSVNLNKLKSRVNVYDEKDAEETYGMKNNYPLLAQAYVLAKNAEVQMRQAEDARSRQQE
jgi:hypothetical protein